MANPSSLSTLSVAELLECCPQAAFLFVHYRMACVGCDIAAFHTVAEATAIYGVDAGRFVQELVFATPTSGQAELSTLPEESE